MEFERFLDLLANDELYLRRTDLFKEDDPWEALPSDDYIRAKLGLRRYDPADELRLINEQAFLRQNSDDGLLSGNPLQTRQKTAIVALIGLKRYATLFICSVIPD